MRREDYKDLEVALAMISVGDSIYAVHSDHTRFDFKTNERVPVNYIEEFKVIKSPFMTVWGLKVELKNERFGPYNQSLDYIDYFNGKLYIWNKNGWYYSDEYENRVEKLIEIINSPNTRFGL